MEKKGRDHLNKKDAAVSGREKKPGSAGAGKSHGKGKKKRSTLSKVPKVYGLKGREGGSAHKKKCSVYREVLTYWGTFEDVPCWRGGRG